MPDLLPLLESTFGFPAFRANQEAVCRAATEGRDVLLVMPTGAGKSLCYQLPAIARGGTALVISPLIALMDDQANKLGDAGLRVARIHSGLPREAARQACRDYLDGKLQFLFIAPERLRVPGFPEMLARRKPALIAIDEAHCISAWGHDFRPDYRLLGEYLPALRPSPILALTATATPNVQRDIVTQLNLRDPALFIHGFRRDNLAIEAVELSKPRREQFTANFLSAPGRRPAIVYAPSRRSAEELAQTLGSRFPAAAYHAGLAPELRTRIQRDFQAGKLEVVVATIAFGMGIDKADVRSVVHIALPASVEAFYQEIGRAGRDGLPARTVLLYSFVDRQIHESFLERDYPASTGLLRLFKALSDEPMPPESLAHQLKMDRDVVAKSLEKLASNGAAKFDIAGNVRVGAERNWQSAYARQVEFRRAQIDSMMHFAESQQCRMTALIRHFGDTADAHRPCGQCDFCAPSAESAQPFAEPDGVQERDLRAILRALDATGKSTGKLHTELARSSDRKVFDNLLDGLARAGLITLANDTWTNPEGRLITFRRATITHEGRTLRPDEPMGVLLRAEVSEPCRKSARKATQTAAKLAAKADEGKLSPAEMELEEKLRAWRKEEAGKTGKPAFLVCGDTALKALARSAPVTIPELLSVAGFGPDKAERYGAALCAICRGEAAAAVPGKLERSSSERPSAATTRNPSAPVFKPRTVPQVASAKGPAEFRRVRTEAGTPEQTLSGDQQALEHRLREWRKRESEKMGLPQFFVLGTTTLRNIVLERPRTLSQLQSIGGIDPDKLTRFGAAILQVCNA